MVDGNSLASFGAADGNSLASNLLFLISCESIKGRPAKGPSEKKADQTIMRFSLRGDQKAPRKTPREESSDNCPKIV